MHRREEIIGKKISEYFQGRTDMLIFRSVQFTDNKSEAGSRLFTLPGGGLAAELYVTKMITIFDKDELVPAGSDVAKRTFLVSSFSFSFLLIY
jgi:hypothetical protein